MDNAKQDEIRTFKQQLRQEIIGIIDIPVAEAAWGLKGSTFLEGLVTEAADKIVEMIFDIVNGVQSGHYPD